MPADVGPHRQPAVGHGPHQVDPPARAVVLVARLDVRRAARRAEPAVDAFLEMAVLDLPGQPVEVDARVAAPSVSVAVAMVPAVPRENEAYSSDTAHESSRVHRSVRVERLLDPLGQGPVGPRLAPDAEPVFPVGRTAREDQVAAVAHGQGAESIDLGGSMVQRPVAQGMQPDDPVAGVRLDGPAAGIDRLDERGRRRTAGR